MPFSIQHDLTEEILDNIVSLCPRASLAALCLSCKKLNRIATAHLYSAIVFDQKKEWEDPLIFFLPVVYLLLTSPSHASLVKTLVLPEPYKYEQDELKEIKEDPESKAKPWPGAGTKDLEKALRGKCAEYGVDEKEANEMYEKIASGLNADAVFALLLANLPNLQKLDLNSGMCSSRHDLIGLLERVGQRMKPFDEIPKDLKDTPLLLVYKPSTLLPTTINPFSNSTLLTDTDAIEKARSKKPIGLFIPIDVMVKFNTDKCPEDPRHVGSFFNLPFLRSISTFMTGDDTNTSSDNLIERLEPCSCGVENIELRRTKIHKDNFQRLMDATIPGKLKSLNYGIGNTWAWCSVEHPAIMKSLEAHHNTLESLGLSHENLLVSFTKFKNLKRLKVAPVYIWGHDGFHEESELKKPMAKEMLWKALPSTIEQLWMHRAQQTEVYPDDATIDFVPDCMIPALDLVLQHKDDAYPGLSQLRIEFELEEWELEWLDLLASLCERMEGNGIQCTIIVVETSYQNYGSLLERKWGWNEDVEFDPIEFNQEPPKSYIVAQEEKNLSETLRGMKVEQDEKLKAKKRHRQRRVRVEIRTSIYEAVLALKFY